MTLSPVTVTSVVASAPATAFEAFVDKVAQWWPCDTHSVSPSMGEGPPETVVIEPRVGGQIYEVSKTGVQHLWGTLIVWEPPTRIAFTWHPGKDEGLATQVTVLFAPTDTGGTAVTLTHTGWEVLGTQADEIRTNYDSGWNGILRHRYTGLVAALAVG